MIMKRLAVLVAAAFVATAFAQDKKAPEAKPADKKAAAPAAEPKKMDEPVGKAMGAAMKATATVEAVDAATRMITLKGEKGNVISFTAGPDVKNFAQIAKGDIVTIEYLEAVAVALKKAAAGAAPSRTDSETMKTAKPGDKPAAMAARTINVTAKVEAIDAANSIVTLKGPKQTVDLKVKDPAVLKAVKVGDMVEAAYVEAVAVRVDKPEKAAAPAAKPAEKKK